VKIDMKKRGRPIRGSTLRENTNKKSDSYEKTEKSKKDSKDNKNTSVISQNEKLPVKADNDLIDLKELADADNIYDEICDYLVLAGCFELIPAFLIHDFCMMRKAYLDCEYYAKIDGKVVDDDKRSPYVLMVYDYHKRMIATYDKINDIINKNSKPAKGGKANSFLKALQEKGF
jgi:hypothetical protein